MPDETGWVEFNDSAIPGLEIGFYWVKWVPPFGNAAGYAKMFAEWEGSYWMIVSTDGSNGDTLEGRVLAYHVMVPPEG